MEAIRFGTDAKGQGGFYIMEGEEQLGEMAISISGEKLTVYHTEVVEKAGGRGLAKKMLETMVAHARSNGLKVIPLCPYVHAQFKRHPLDYADIWSGAEKQK
jgi:uncharacterized protein